MSKLKIFEEVKKNDISNVYAQLVTPIPPKDTSNPLVQPTKVHCFSCFNNHYNRGEEREFIEELDAKNPGLYESYSICYFGSN